MIKIDFSYYICYYLSIALSGLMFFWYCGRKKVKRQGLVSRDRVLQCSTCTYVYFESKVSKISTCPLCGSFNSRSQKIDNVTS